jgi:hypothetical protein
MKLPSGKLARHRQKKLQPLMTGAYLHFLSITVGDQRVAAKPPLSSTLSILPME